MTSATSIFSETDKFDGTNWPSWRRLIRTAATARGVFGYIDRTIKQPPTLPITTSTLPTTSPTPLITTINPPETPWDSANPSTKEWAIRDAWAIGLLIFNTKNPVGLGINIDGTAAEAWTSYINTYEKASNMSRLNAEQSLRNMTYTDCTNFTDFITAMQSKWSDARALGAKIPYEDFKNIIINALPDSWDPAVAALYDPNMSSSEAISRLQTWYARISRNRPTTITQTTSALQTSIPRQRQRSQLICVNPNCGRRGHIIKNCYWPGGGKEGQFPPGFGK